jgi:hypothetical protein
MVLGTADEAGVPWVTPVRYAQSDYRRFVWGLVARPQAFSERQGAPAGEHCRLRLPGRGRRRAGGVHVGSRRGAVGRRTRARDRLLRRGRPRAGSAPAVDRGARGHSGAASAVSGDGVAILGPSSRQQSPRPRRGHAVASTSVAARQRSARRSPRPARRRRSLPRPARRTSPSPRRRRRCSRVGG